MAITRQDFHAESARPASQVDVGVQTIPNHGHLAPDQPVAFENWC
jgi:hypothetical protein